jgi:hypothetical protein
MMVLGAVCKISKPICLSGLAAKGVEWRHPEAQNMATVPLLSVRQWKLIEPLLAEKKRDRVVVSAILYRQFSGCGLRDVAEWFGLSRARLAEWSVAMERDGSLARVMKALKLEPADWLCWSRGGRQYYARGGAEMKAAVVRLKFQNFREALRR